MRGSWAETGFPEHAIFGHVCNRKVYWDLLAEEKRTASKKAEAGAPIELNYAPLRLGAAPAGEDDSDSDSEEEDTRVAAAGAATGVAALPPKKRRLTSGDFLAVGPLTYGEGKKMIDEDHDQALLVHEEKRQRALERKEDEVARLRERKELARSAAKRLWKARGEYKKLVKKELCSFLAEIAATVPDTSGKGEVRLPKSTDALKEVLWPAYEKSLANAKGVWETMVLVLYSPPADELGADMRALPIATPHPVPALPAPAHSSMDPLNLIGKAVSKRFGRKYYAGKVDKYSPLMGYHVAYEDGDHEDVSSEEALAIVTRAV
eukprot:7382636-Prymnesium_polylepis.1